VRIRGCESDRVSCSTGAPQGTVLAPFLFTICISDFNHNSDHVYLQKFSDDSAIVGLISADDDGEYRELIQTFWNGASGTASTSTPVRPRGWWWTSAVV